MPHEYMACKYRVFVKIYQVELTLWYKISNWAKLVIISFCSSVRVAKRYSKNQNIFVGFLEILKKVMVKNWILSKIAFISFRIRIKRQRARILKWAQAVKPNLR